VLGKRGDETTSRRRTGAGGGAPRGDDGVPVAGGQEAVLLEHCNTLM
jgi:hypothetical protein